MQGDEAIKNLEQPSQSQIDKVPSFVEAARELRKEPFFHIDEKRNFRRQGEDYTFEVGDRFHFRSALVTFRRIWMSGEASNFFSCYNTLWMFLPTLQNPLLEDWRQRVSGVLARNAFIGLLQSIDEKLSTGELIDLWINSVFAHISIQSPDDKRYKFEFYLEKYGQAFMEYAFRIAVWQLGLQYENMRKHAEHFLSYWQEKGLRPTFHIGAPFGEQIREVTSQGHVLIRKGSSRFYNEESAERLVDRVLIRNQNRDIKTIFDKLDVSSAQKTKLAIYCETVQELLERSGMNLQLEQLDLTNGFPIRPEITSYASLFDFETRRKSAVLSDGVTVITDEWGLGMLNQAFSELKIQIQKAALE